MVGKVRLASTWLRNHWWNVTLYPSTRGLTTGLLRPGSVRFDLEFDFVEHRLVMRADGRQAEPGSPLLAFR